MPLVTFWVHTGGNSWERRLLDAENLPPPIPEEIPPPRPPPPKRRTDYQTLAAVYNRQIKSGFDRNSLSRVNAALLNYEHKLAMGALLGRIQLRQRGLRQWAISEGTDDHEYIEGMFSLYAQGRTRLQ